MKTPDKNTCAGFTLVEVMTAIGCGSIVLAALLTASVCLQRSFAAVAGYAITEGDQLRVQDYIAMDCRRAIDVQIDNGSWVQSGGTWSWVSNANGPQTLNVTLPTYYDATTKNPVAPSFDANGTLQYGGGGSVTISYYQSGSSFMRQVGPDPTAAKPFGLTAIATNVSSFNVTPLDQSTVNGTVTCSITFTPRFVNSAGAAATSGTTVYASTFLRNAQARPGVVIH